MRPNPQRQRLALLLIVLALFAASGSFAQSHPDSYRIVHVYPHDAEAFTQGLVYVSGTLYESTGLFGRSTLRAEDLKTGSVLQRVEVPKEYFAEGLTDWQGRLIQLTWKSHTGFIYDPFSFHLIRSFHYDGEGWGLTQDGHDLILSDGTATLRFLDPKDFHEVRRATVTENGRPVADLNELEYIHGQIYANIWHSDRIVRISPETGHVLGWLDLSNLYPAGERSDDEAVLNGIAWDPKSGHLFVTGKLWPKLFELELVKAEPRAQPAKPKVTPE